MLLKKQTGQTSKLATFTKEMEAVEDVEILSVPHGKPTEKHESIPVLCTMQRTLWVLILPREYCRNNCSGFAKLISFFFTE